MPLSSRGHRRACDQGPVVKKRDPLVCDRDDDLERALRSVLGSSVLRRLRVSLPVVVLMFERSVMAWPERVLGPKQKLSVCDPCREHESGESYQCSLLPHSVPHAVKLHARSNQKTRRCRPQPLLQIWSQWVENWTVFTITRPI